MQLLRADFQRIYLDVMMWIVYMAALYGDVLFSSTAGRFSFEMHCLAGLCSSRRSRRYIFTWAWSFFFLRRRYMRTFRIEAVTCVQVGSHSCIVMSHGVFIAPPLYFTSWKCPVLLWGWLCQMWHIHHLVIAFVIKFFRLVTHKGHSILPN